MKRSDLLKLVLIGVLAVQTEIAQTRAYVKFGPSGESIGLFNLSKPTKECESWRTFTGTVTDLHAEMRGRRSGYKFTVRSSVASIKFGFVLDKDEIPFGDIESLLGRRHAVKVRSCRHGNRDWKVEEIALMQ